MAPKEIKLPRPLSYSSLSLYAECPQKYKFRYVDRIPEKPKHFFSFGNSVHQALEFFYDVKIPPPPTLEDVLSFYKENWLSAGYKDQAQEQQYFEDGREILTLFHQKHVADFQVPLFVEYQFNLEVSGVPVTGKVDRVDKLADGRLAVVDYKTGKALAKGRVDTDEQLTLYQMACEKLLEAKVSRLTFYHLPSLTEHTVERRGRTLVRDLEEKIVSTADSITRSEFEPKPEEKKCYWCDYKPICPVFSAQAARAKPETAATAAAFPAPSSEEELSGLIDRYGDIAARLAETSREAEDLKREILSVLESKGYVRSFGRKYEVQRFSSERWEFSDKKKVLDLLQELGFYDRVLAPSAPKIQQLFLELSRDAGLQARLASVGERVETPDLKVKPI